MPQMFYFIATILITLLLPACTETNRLDLKGSDRNGIPFIRVSWGAEDNLKRTELSIHQTDGVSSQSIPTGKFIDLGPEFGRINGPDTVQSKFQLQEARLVYGPSGEDFEFLLGLSYTNIDVAVSTPTFNESLEKSGFGLLAGLGFSIVESDRLRYSIRLTRALYFGKMSAQNDLISISAIYSLSPEFDVIAGISRWDHENYEFVSELDFSVSGLMLGLEYKL